MAERRAEGFEGRLRITVVRLGRAVVLGAAGEIDLATGHRLRAELARLLEHVEALPVLLDLTEVTFLGSTGIAVLVDAHWQAQQRQVPLQVIIAANGPVKQALQVSGVDHHLVVRHDLNSAMATLTNSG